MLNARDKEDGVIHVEIVPSRANEIHPVVPEVAIDTGVAGKPEVVVLWLKRRHTTRDV
jgi:hypothetical protein